MHPFCNIVNIYTSKKLEYDYFYTKNKYCSYNFNSYLYLILFQFLLFLNTT